MVNGIHLRTKILSDKLLQNREIPFTPSTIDTVDLAMYDYINEELNLHTTTNEGWKKTPVIWVSAERSFQIKQDKRLRDNKGTFILPVITLERTSIVKNPANRGIYWSSLTPQQQFAGDLGGGVIEIAKRLNQDKTSNFANADAKRVIGQDTYPRENKKLVYQTITIPIPVYVEVVYSIDVKTEYQQQMNEITQTFVTAPGGNNRIYIKRDGHKYEGFIQQDYSQNNNVADLGEEERLFHTTIEVRVLGYLIGQNDNQNQPKIVIRENQVDVKIPRERVIVGDIKDLTNKKIF
jgi:hypothetical protein